MNSLAGRAALLAAVVMLAGAVVLLLLPGRTGPWGGVLVTLVVAGSFGLTLLLLHRLIRRPLHLLGDRMEEVAIGNFSVRVTEPLPTELQPLALHFNSMVGALQSLQEELRQAHFRQMEHVDRLASVGEMAAGLAHEIRNPLAGIGGAVSVLASGLPVEDDRQPILREILQQIGRLDQAVTNLLSYARPGLPEIGPCDLNDLVRKTLFFVSQHPEARRIHRVEELTLGLPPARADAKQVQQVLLNLLLNAIQAMAPEGTLRVTTERAPEAEGSRLRLRVSDTGPGIPAELRERIFTPFFTTKLRGTGLGLAICRRLAEQNGGAVRAESAVGGGAMMILELPVWTGPNPEDT